MDYYENNPDAPDPLKAVKKKDGFLDGATYTS